MHHVTCGDGPRDLCLCHVAGAFNSYLDGEALRLLENACALEPFNFKHLSNLMSARLVTQRLGRTHYSLLTTHCSLLTARYSQLTTHCSLLATMTYYLLPTTYYLLPTSS
jgi:hypothetical protein